MTHGRTVILSRLHTGPVARHGLRWWGPIPGTKDTDMSPLLALATAWLLATGTAHAQEAPPERPDFFRHMQCDRPEYPGAAARVGAQGRVGFSINVGDNSTVTSVDITQEAGESREHRLLGRVVKDTIMKCRWRGDVAVPPGVYSGAYVWKLDKP